MSVSGTRPLTWWEVTVANGDGRFAPRRTEVVRGEDEVAAGTLAVARARWSSQVIGTQNVDPFAWRVVAIRRLEAA